MMDYNEAIQNDIESIEKEVECLNSIIENAIEHGGDAGGPYFSNDTMLKKSIEYWLIFKGLFGEFMVTDDNIPKIVRRV